jgi:hypothetical protein
LAREQWFCLQGNSAGPFQLLELVFVFDGDAFLLAYLARYHALPLLWAGEKVRIA